MNLCDFEIFIKRIVTYEKKNQTYRTRFIQNSQKSH